MVVGVNIFIMYVRNKILQVNFHPLILGTHLVQLGTFRNIKKAIGSKRETEW